MNYFFIFTLIICCFLFALFGPKDPRVWFVAVSPHPAVFLGLPYSLRVALPSPSLPNYKASIRRRELGAHLLLEGPEGLSWNTVPVISSQ